MPFHKYVSFRLYDVFLNTGLVCRSSVFLITVLFISNVRVCFKGNKTKYTQQQHHLPNPAEAGYGGLECRQILPLPQDKPESR